MTYETALVQKKTSFKYQLFLKSLFQPAYTAFGSMFLRQETHRVWENESHVTKQDILMLMPLQYVWLNSQLQNNNNSLHSLYFSLRTPLLAPCSSAGKLQSLWKCLGVRGLLLLTRANDKKKRICADLLTYFFSTEPSCFTAPWWQFKPRPFDRTNKAVGPGKNPKLINIGPTFIPESWVRIKRYFDSIGCMYYSETSKYIALLSLAI